MPLPPRCRRAGLAVPNGAILAVAQVAALHAQPHAAAPALAAFSQGSSNGRHAGGGARMVQSAPTSPMQSSRKEVVISPPRYQPEWEWHRRHRHPATAVPLLLEAGLPALQLLRQPRGRAGSGGGGSAECGSATSGAGLPSLPGAAAEAVRRDPRFSLSLSGQFVARPRRR